MLKEKNYIGEILQNQVINTAENLTLKKLFIKDYIVTFSLRPLWLYGEMLAELEVLIEKSSNSNYWDYAAKGTKNNPQLIFKFNYPKYLMDKINQVYSNLYLLIYGHRE